MANYKWGNITVETTGQLQNAAKTILRDGERVVDAGAANVLSLARAYAPHRFGDLQEGIIAAPGFEKAGKTGKIVKDIYMDESMNAVFQKPYKNRKGHAYYPASQEYGFNTKSGGYKDGVYFMKRAAVSYSASFEASVEAALDAGIERAKHDL